MAESAGRLRNGPRACGAATCSTRNIPCAGSTSRTRRRTFSRVRRSTGFTPNSVILVPGAWISVTFSARSLYGHRSRAQSVSAQRAVHSPDQGLHRPAECRPAAQSGDEQPEHPGVRFLRGRLRGADSRVACDVREQRQGRLRHEGPGAPGAHMTDWGHTIDAVLSGLVATSPLEAASVALGLAYAVLAIRRS